MAKTAKLPADRVVGAIGGDSPTNNGKHAIDMRAPYRIEVTVEGVAPLLFHRYSCESVESKSASKKGSKERKTDDVESYVYRDDKGNLCLPGEYLRGAIVGAAKYLQDPRSPRKSAMDLYKAGIVVITPLVSLGTKAWDYIDKRGVVVQRARIPRSRPAMNEGWKATFIMLVNLPQYIGEADIHEAVEMAGKFCGFGDFRPTYGRFRLVGINVLG